MNKAVSNVFLVLGTAVAWLVAVVVSLLFQIIPVMIGIALWVVIYLWITG